MDGLLIFLGSFATAIFLHILLNRRRKNKIKGFLLTENQKTWPANRVYVQEEKSGLNFFVEPINGIKTSYDILHFFDEDHRPPAHIETVLDIRTGVMKTTRNAYVSPEKFRELTILP